MLGQRMITRYINQSLRLLALRERLVLLVSVGPLVLVGHQEQRAFKVQLARLELRVFKGQRVLLARPGLLVPLVQRVLVRREQQALKGQLVQLVQRA
jgi:hypothetical protein